MEPMPLPVTAEPAQAPSSLAARLFNVFATPGDVFAEIKSSKPCLTNWLVPVLISCVVGVISVLVLFSQDTLVRQIKEKQELALEKKLQKMPKEQREQVREQTRAFMEKFTSPIVLKTSGAVGAIAGSFGWLFFIALVVWLVGRFGLKASSLS